LEVLPEVTRTRTIGAFSLPKLTPSRRDKWLVVALLFFVGVINYADRTSITAVYSLLKTDLGFSDIGLGAIGSFFLWSYALASPLAGHIGDRTNRAAALTWSLAAWSLVTLLTGFVTARWQLLGMRITLGFVEAMYLPAAMALVAEYHAADTRAKALSLLSVGQYLGMVAGGTLAGFLGERYGWRSPLWVLGAAGVLLALVCFMFLPRGIQKETPNQDAPASRISFLDAVSGLVRIPSFLVLAMAGVLTAIGTWIFINWLPLYFTENLGMSLTSAGFFGSSLVSISAAVSQLGGAAVSDVLAQKGLHRRLLMQVVLIFCAAPTLLVFVFTKNRIAIMVALVLYSAFRNAGDLNIIPLLCDLVGKHRMSVAIGVTNMLNTLAGGIGILAAGFLKQGMGLTGVFASVAGILFIDALVLLGGYVLFIRRDLQRA
jgi:predicted MFS family arabinose efflux permease